jgi:PAS domain S-box-containing protein
VPDESSHSDVAQRLASIVESSDDAIVSKTLDGVVTSWNAAAERLFGYTAAEAVGRSILQIIPPERHSEEIEVLAKLRRGEKIEHFETVRIAKGGREVPISLSVSPIRDPGGRIVGASKIARDISDRVRAEELRGTLAAIIESSDDAIVSKTLDGVITSWNAAAERLYGYTAAEAVGQSVLMIIPHELHFEETEVLRRIRRGEKVEHFETVRMTRDGRSIPISLTISPIRDARGRIVGASKIARDISLQKELERLRARELEAAESANRAKDDFLAMFGHELRNPLAAVASATDLLDSVRDLSDLEQPRAVLKRQSRHLQRLIDDLLEAARVRAGKIALERRRLDLAKAVDHALAVVEIDPVRRANVEKSLESVSVFADPDRLEQLIQNLVANALKYTPAGKRIRVAVRAEGDWALLCVKDEGIGIEPDMLPKIFDLFVQGASSLDRAGGGLGIGLSLVKTLAELHGGSVEAESEGPGKGSCFSVRLPRVEPAGSDEAPPEVPDRSTPSRILLVEDNDDAREMLGAILRLQGHEVHEAADGAQALEVAARVEPEVMLVDIGLPVFDGYEVARRIRRMQRQPRLLVALTGYGQPEDRRACMAAGFDGHVVKPIDLAQLTRLIASGGSRRAK